MKAERKVSIMLVAIIGISILAAVIAAVVNSFIAGVPAAELDDEE